MHFQKLFSILLLFTLWAMPIQKPTVAPVPTPEPTRTIGSAKPLTVQQKCIQLLPSISKKHTYPGKLILSGSNDTQSANDIYVKGAFFDFSNLTFTSFTSAKPYQIAVSPDRTKYAIQYVSQRQTVVYQSDGKKITTIPQGATPWVVSQWSGNDRLIFAYTIQNGHFLVYPKDIATVDLSTHKQTQLKSDYPDIDKDQHTIIWEGWVTTKYDSKLSRVVYLGSIRQDDFGKNGTGYIMWDLHDNKKIVSVVSDGFTTTPIWSPDDSRFLIKVNGDILEITRDGTVSNLTNFNHGGKNPNSIFYDLDFYEWSPDGKQIAFWLTTYFPEKDKPSITELAVIDLEKSTMTNYCLLSGKSVQLNIYNTPVWSPDGKYLAVMADPENSGTNRTYLIDLGDITASKISEERHYPVGWLESSPQSSTK